MGGSLKTKERLVNSKACGLHKCIGRGTPCELACVLLLTVPPAVQHSSAHVGCDVVKGTIDDKLQEVPSLCLQK